MGKRGLVVVLKEPTEQGLWAYARDVILEFCVGDITDVKGVEQWINKLGKARNSAPLLVILWMQLMGIQFIRKLRNNGSSATSKPARHVEPRQPSSDRLLQFLSRFIPRKNREEIVGDLREDLAEFRQEGLGERRLILHVLWQLFYCVAPRLAKWGTFGWLAEAVRKYLAK
jgi:hypothetical protein